MHYRMQILRSARLAILVLAVAQASTARADWYVNGAQYVCTNRAFVLIPYVQSSDNETPTIPQGYKVLPDGQSEVSCRIGSRRLNAQILVSPPQSHGMCGGVGYVGVNSVAVDGVEILENAIPFNWSCGEENSVVKLVVKNAGRLVEFEKCTVKTDFDQWANPAPTCSKASFDVDSIAAANAKADHHLADLSTQAAESATRLPPENDLAKVFPTSFPETPSIPLCAHWHAVYLNGLVSPSQQRQGYIAGNAGERTYIRRTNPQLCNSLEDDGCAVKPYVIPGDRVNVGFICGSWTHIQYPSRIRSRLPTEGWVETARLYGVSSVPKKTSTVVEVNTEKASSSDPLARAILEGQTDSAIRLIAAGSDPNGPDNAGTPLATAVRLGDVRLVQALLNGGARVDLFKESNGKCALVRLASRNEEILGALVKAGMDLNCRGGQFGSTALMDIAYYNRLWAWERIYVTGRAASERLEDPLVMTKRLLQAGADPNVQDVSFGRTALFYAAESNNIDIAEFLLSSGANPNATIDTTENGASLARQTGSTPLMEALHWYSLTIDPTMIRLLLAHGANPNYRNASKYNQEWDETTQGAVTFAGQTILTRAAQDGHYTVVRMLLEHGADPTIPRQDGMLAEAIAEQKHHPKIASLIVTFAKEWAARNKP